jgi:hypothetical protein
MLAEECSQFFLINEIPPFRIREPGFDFGDLPCFLLEKRLDRARRESIARNLQLAREVVEKFGLMIGELDPESNHERGLSA